MSRAKEIKLNVYLGPSKLVPPQTTDFFFVMSIFLVSEYPLGDDLNITMGSNILRFAGALCNLGPIWVEVVVWAEFEDTYRPGYLGLLARLWT